MKKDEIYSFLCILTGVLLTVFFVADLVVSYVKFRQVGKSRFLALEGNKAILPMFMGSLSLSLLGPLLRLILPLTGLYIFRFLYRRYEREFFEYGILIWASFALMYAGQHLQAIFTWYGWY